MIKNIVFDIGNVLVEFGWKNFIEGFGFSEEINQRIVAATIKNGAWNEYDRGVMTEDEIVDTFVKNDPGIETELRAMCENFAGLLPQFEYTKGWIKDLQNKGFKVFCLSNMSYKAVRECPDSLDFLPMLDGYVLSCDVKMIKPEKEIYQYLFNKYKLIPEECIFVDDIEANINAAKENGMHGVVFKDLKQAVFEIESIVAKEKGDAKFESSYTKPQRAAALICAVLIGLLFLSTLVFALLKFSWASTMFKISLGCTLVLPCLTWCYIWMIGKMSHKETIADFRFFSDKK